jgi:tetratricopeptide (TPR) repeat protein
MMMRNPIVALLLAVAACAALPLHAQTGTYAEPGNYDYYASGGTELLRNVERYHVGPGEQKLRSRQYQYAYGDFTFILHYFPNHPQALMLIAQTCDRWKSPHCDLAETFEKAIAVNPTAPGTWVVQGIVQSRAKQWPAAIASLKRAVELDPRSLNGHYNLGLAYLETGQFELANQHAQRAYALGAPVPGLRDRLKRAGHWRPADPETATLEAPAGAKR